MFNLTNYLNRNEEHTTAWLSPETIVRRLLASADVEINGQRDWDIQVHDQNFYTRVLLSGSMGFGESYVDGQWDSRRLDQLIFKILRSGLDKKIGLAIQKLSDIRARLMNLQSFKRAFAVAERHYNLNDELFCAMLDKDMVYTCAYWKDADGLDQAQENKLDLVCKKLKLKPGMRVLDIGCGWGSFARFAAKNYDAHVLGVTISQDQAKIAQMRCNGLPVNIKLMDYRDLDGVYDRVVSLGMFEHVGYKNYKSYMQIANKCLADDGLFLLHTIGGNKTTYTTDPWINKYIFPNGMIPSAKQITDAIEDKFVIEDIHSFGVDYDRTLMAWFNNFDNSWDSLKDAFDDRFYRMWKYYLLSCAGSFRARKNQLWQLLLSKQGVVGGLQCIR